MVFRLKNARFDLGNIEIKTEGGDYHVTLLFA